MVERREFQAAIHGAELKGKKESFSYSKDKTNKDSIFLFRDPEEYKELSEEARAELTVKMKGLHKSWVESRPLGGKTRSTPKFFMGG